MTPNCFLLPFLFLFFLSSSVQGDLKAIPTGIPDCPSYDCGNGEQVVYPFWVRDRSANSTSYCGYPTLELTCEGDKPSLTTLSGSYTVSSITATTRTLTLVDSDVVGQTCPRARHNVSFGGKPLRFGNSTTYLVFCFNSTVGKPLAESVGVPVFPIDCLDDTKGSSSYVFEEANVDSSELDATLHGACRGGVVRSPVSEDDVGDKNLSSYFGKAMNNGFEVAWENSPWSRHLRCERSGGRCGYHNKSGGGLEFQCFCKNGIHPNGDCHGGTGSTETGSNVRKSKIGLALDRAPNKKGLMIGLAFGGLLLCLAFAGCGGFVYCRKYRTSSTLKCLSNENNVEVFLNRKLLMLAVKQYRYAQVKKMTKGFKEQLGQGGYGTVYKGRLSDGSLVAVKILRQTNGSGEEEFINEISSIGRTNHVNVVSLLGFCSEGSRRALIYEFMPNGSLDKLLFAADAKLKTFLDWEKLHNIAIGIASGLEYLHRGCKTPMLHFDIKPHNILLDEDLCPKISDFGLAKFYKVKESILSSMACARGTIGYIAPEVFSRSFGAVSSKSDVYSYGMVILEMVGRRRNVNRSENTSEVYFPHWIYEHLDEYCAGPQETACAVDSIEGENSEIARRMALVGLWCIQTSPTSRPSISRVVEMLKGDAGNLAIPPKPYICSPERSGRCSNVEDIATFTFSSSG